MANLLKNIRPDTLTGVESNFLKMIIEEPHQQSHKLVMADWLEERGRCNESALIREMCGA